MESPKQGEMSTSDVHNLFEDNMGFLRNIHYIQLTGGKPFLQEDLPELGLDYSQQPPHLQLLDTTQRHDPGNLEKTAEMLEILEKRSLRVSVSIDELEDTNDARKKPLREIWE